MNPDAIEPLRAGRHRPITVAFTPTWPKNPYHAQLILHLREHGVNVLVHDSLKQIVRQIGSGGRPPELVHLHSIPSFSFSPFEVLRQVFHFCRILKLRKLGVKFVITVHDLIDLDAMLPFGNLLIGQILSTKMDALHVHSLSAKRELLRAWHLKDDGRISVIYHPNYIDCYPNVVGRAEARRRLNYSESEVVFLVLGHIRPYKGIDVLLNSFANLPGEDYRLLIAGAVRPGLGKGLRRDCQNDKRVRLIDEYIPDSDIQLYMNACDIVVLPYRRAFTSGAAILAMSFSKPCVATNTGAFPDVLDENGAFFCTPNDPISLTDSMKQIGALRAQIPTMGNYNLERVSQWRWGEMADNMAEMYRSVLNQSCDDNRNFYAPEGHRSEIKAKPENSRDGMSRWPIAGVGQ